MGKNKWRGDGLLFVWQKYLYSTFIFNDDNIRFGYLSVKKLCLNFKTNCLPSMFSANSFFNN